MSSEYLLIHTSHLEAFLIVLSQLCHCHFQKLQKTSMFCRESLAKNLERPALKYCLFKLEIKLGQCMLHSIVISFSTLHNMPMIVKQ